MNFIKQHWFGLLTGLFIFCVLVLFILVLLSPRQDVQRRGFIPCTEAMAEQMLACSEQGKTFCMLDAVLGNSWCDLKVVGRGIGQWLRGEQSTPWSNYIFIPEEPAFDSNFDEQARREYFTENPDTPNEMQELQQLNEELENEQPDINPGEQPQ